MTNGGLGVAFFSPFDNTRLLPPVETNSCFTNRCHAILDAKGTRDSSERSRLDFRDPLCIPCIDIASERPRGHGGGSESMIVEGKPRNHAAVELLRNHTNRTAVTCTRNFPERQICRVVVTNPLRLLNRDIVI